MARYTVFFMNCDGTRSEFGVIGYTKTQPELLKAVTLAASAGYYTQVATIEAEDLEDAWGKTNSIEYPWYQSDCVIDFRGMRDFEGRSRSAMVGDLYIDENDNVYICASFGFKPVATNSFISNVIKTILVTNDREAA